jgi:hypothetical protein
MIDQHWRGRIYVFKNERGHDLVSLEPPQGKWPRPVARIYATSGPYWPLDDDEPVLIGDAAKWMATMNAEGFVFVLVDSGLDFPAMMEAQLVEA